MNDETQNTMSTDNNNDTMWMDMNNRGQIVRRPRRFRGLTQREGFADYVEKAYWVARRLGMLEELAALPSLDDMTVTAIADMTRGLGDRIRERMRSFHDGYGPNIYYGALTRMVTAAKEDINPTTAVAASTPLPTLPTSPLIRQSGVTETVSDSEIDMGRAALRDVKHSIAASLATGRDRVDEEAENHGDMVIRSAAAADISGHSFSRSERGRPGVTGAGAFIRTVPGFADHVVEELPLLFDGERDSDEDSASVEDEEEEEETDGHEVTDTVDDGDEADTEGGDEENTEEEETDVVTAVPERPVPAVLHQNIDVELPLWAWMAILVAFAAWAALVNGVLSRDLGCRPFGGR